MEIDLNKSSVQFNSFSVDGAAGTHRKLRLESSHQPAARERSHKAGSVVGVRLLHLAGAHDT